LEKEKLDRQERRKIILREDAEYQGPPRSGKSRVYVRTRKQGGAVVEVDIKKKGMRKR